MTLNSINFGDNRWCGPSVLSAIAGINTDEAEKLFCEITGRDHVDLVSTDWLKEAFRRLGYNLLWIKPMGSLYATLTMLAMKGNAVYMLVVPRHVVAIEVIDKRIYFVDNHTKSPMNAAASARMMQRVTHVYRVEKKA